MPIINLPDHPPLDYISGPQAPLAPYWVVKFSGYTGARDPNLETAIEKALREPLGAPKRTALFDDLDLDLDLD